MSDSECPLSMSQGYEELYREGALASPFLDAIFAHPSQKSLSSSGVMLSMSKCSG